MTKRRVFTPSRICIYFLLAVPLLWWLPWLDFFAYAPEAQFSDLVISHWPNSLYIAHTIQHYGEVPFWSDLILGGYPFVADPLSGLWYPPGWLTILLPSVIGFNLALFLHFYWLGLGTFHWLRGQGHLEWSALLGAWTIMLFPKLIAHWAAGHVTLLYAFCWTPWVLLAEDRRAKDGRERMPMGVMLLPGIVLGMTWLADLRWGAMLSLFWLGYAFIQNRGRFWPMHLYWKRLLLLGLQPVWALMISAPLLLPLLEWLPLTTRASLLPDEAAIYSLGLPHLLGVLLPGLIPFHEWVTYLGIIPLCMAILVLSIPELRRRLWGWFVVVLLAWAFAMGPSLPLWQILARLPGFDLLRVPSRTWFFVGWVASICTAAGSEWLIKRKSFLRLDPMLWMVGLLTFQMLMGLALHVLWNRPIQSVLHGVVFLVAWIGVMIVTKRQKAISQRLLQAAMALLVLLDLWFSTFFWISFRPSAQVSAEGIEAANFIARDSTIFRVYSPSYSIPQHAAALVNLELADGINPLQLSSYAKFMEIASGVPNVGYSVTLPPLEGTNPKIANRNYLPNPVMLGWLNVKYLVSEFDIPVEGLRERARFGETRVYENEHVFPRAWVQANFTWPPQMDHEARILERSPNSWHVQAQGPGWLIIAEVAYPGWQVYVDGKQWTLVTLADLFRAIYLPAGEHEVEMVFWPRYLWLGIVLATGVWLAFIINTVLECERRS